MVTTTYLRQDGATDRLGVRTVSKPGLPSGCARFGRNNKTGTASRSANRDDGTTGTRWTESDSIDRPGAVIVGDVAERSDLPSLLTHRRRRYLLYCLHLYSNSLPLPEIAHQITVWEQPDSAGVCPQARLRTYMSLYHDHLPKLVRADLIRYEQGADVVELGPAAARVRSPLESQLRRDIDELLAAEWPQ